MYSIRICPLSAGTGLSGCFAVFSGVFIAEDGVGENGLGDITTVDVQALFEAFLNMSTDVNVP